MQIGCRKESIEYWKNNYYKIGLDNNYTEEQIKEYRQYILMIDKIINKQEV